MQGYVVLVVTMRTMYGRYWQPEWEIFCTDASFTTSPSPYCCVTFIGGAMVDGTVIQYQRITISND